MTENHHHHGHHHHKKNKLSFGEQLETLFKHWINHNESHGNTYREWSDKAKDKKINDIANLLNEVSSMTDSINGKIKEALELIKK